MRVDVNRPALRPTPKPEFEFLLLLMRSLLGLLRGRLKHGPGRHIDVKRTGAFPVLHLNERHGRG